MTGWHKRKLTMLLVITSWHSSTRKSNVFNSSWTDLVRILRFCKRYCEHKSFMFAKHLLKLIHKYKFGLMNKFVQFFVFAFFKKNILIQSLWKVLQSIVQMKSWFKHKIFSTLMGEKKDWITFTMEVRWIFRL